MMYAYCCNNITIHFCAKINFRATVRTFLLHSHIPRGVKYMTYENFMMHKNRAMAGIDRNVKSACSEIKPLVRMQ